MRTAHPHARRWLPRALLLAAGVAAAAVVGAGTAQASDGAGMFGDTGRTGQVSSGSAAPAARDSGGAGTVVQSADGGGGASCSVYANGSGFGSYCARGVAGLTLIDRFTYDAINDFEPCRYEDPPPGIAVPDTTGDGQEWFLRTCMTDIKWDTFAGGIQRKFSLDLVLRNRADVDTTYDETPLSEFLWKTRQRTYPLAFMRPEPSPLPVVGVPTYFTFDWLEPDYPYDPVSDGPYEGDENGAPYVQEENLGLIMQAEATKVTIDSHIIGEDPIVCSREDLEGYDPREPPLPQDQDSECYLIFERSSAQADQLSDRPVRDSSGRAYSMEVTVHWRVLYGTDPGNLQPLGGGFDQPLNQALQVRDSEAINEPLYDLTVG